MDSSALGCKLGKNELTSEDHRANKKVETTSTDTVLSQRPNTKLDQDFWSLTA